MIDRIQGQIADFLHKRGFSGGGEFATDAAEMIVRHCSEYGWNTDNIFAALKATKTAIFRTNRSVKKSDALEELAKKLARLAPAGKTSTAESSSVCRILFFGANPLSTDRLQLDEEVRAIQKNLAATPRAGRLVFELALAVRPDDVIQRLNEVRPHVLHFSGHGSAANGIALCDESGSAHHLTDAGIDRLFVAMGKGIRLVVLNACFSAAQAALISNHIDFVIGMKMSVRDDAATLFAASVYRGLAFGNSIQNAFDQGIAAIAVHGVPEHETPVLITKKGRDASCAFLL